MPGRTPRPSWLCDATLTPALEAHGRYEEAHHSAPGTAVRDVILAHHPALPMTHIAEAVHFVAAVQSANIDIGMEAQAVLPPLAE